MLNVIPLNDLKEQEEQSTCECCPKVWFEKGEMIIVHNSFDKREEIEEGGMQDCGEHPTFILYEGHN
ncbi:hypothetical protein UFOVP129_6 [uncultured Caudovirales phage]|uniref:Uncharacterized protein n=1 Tax=uncultured Caudovirales phage TaxID=2100421 RepID=A0A6J5LBT2_9CAUD|nr:hypothetical protein UFOVP129_6 [uncultured Caudovirales phage]